MKKVLPPAYFLAAILIAVILHYFLPLQQLFQFPWRLGGLVPVVIGIALALAADRSFRMHNTTVKPFQKSSALVTSGVFSLTRNPMYLGLTLVLLGVVILLGSVTPFSVVFVLPLLLDRVFIAEEERILEQTFGEGFLEYRARVRRWL
jgi:protein-S-isoprenylcysteine O-methyltransferase Ste14